MSRKIMILGASILQLPAIEKAKEMGLEVIAVDMNPDAEGFKVPGVIKEVISTIDTPAIIEAARRHRIDGIMTLATDMPMRSVASVAKEMGLTGIDEGTALRATNKAEMRKALKAYNVPVPRFFTASDESEYNEVVKQFSVPFIVKPVDSSGSRGIFEVTDITDQNMVRKAYDYCKPYSKTGDVIVEEYMSGPEVSVETLSIDGTCHVLQITDKLTTGAPHYVEMGHSQPTRHSKEIAKKISETAIAANKAIGIKNGPSHTEIIITGEGPKIVEIGARLGGDCITTHLVPLSTGVDMVECNIRIAMGEKPDISCKYNRGSAIRYLSTENGVIKNIKGLDAAKKTDGVVQVSIVHNVGDRVDGIKSSGDRVGFVIAQGRNAAEAIKSAESALSTIKVEVHK